jgi:glycosyltransferase involved in cell wall biosynthesis
MRRTSARRTNLHGHRPKAARAEPPFTIGFFGRIAPEKGLHLLADACRLRQRPGVPPTRLLAAGYLLNEPRPYFDGIVLQIADWGLADQFSLCRRAGPDGQDRAVAGNGRHEHVGDLRRAHWLHVD